jgi:DUF4097 and DUF4098 domain-containing protein YvlB
MKSFSLLLFLLVPSFTFAEIHQESRKIELPAEGIDTLVVKCGAGSLGVKGVEDIERLRVTAVIEIEASKDKDIDAAIAKNLRLTLEKRENKALLTSDINIAVPEKLESRINLEVEIPKGMHLEILDGSGPIEIIDILGTLTIDDDSGSIELENIVGNTTVADSSGSIVINDVTGNVVVKDGSGLIEITNITGDVSIVDGSGHIIVLHVLGNVTVKDGSGDIDVSDVASNVSIWEAGSGEVNIERINGKIMTPDELVESD